MNEWLIFFLQSTFIFTVYHRYWIYSSLAEYFYTHTCLRCWKAESEDEEQVSTIMRVKCGNPAPAVLMSPTTTSSSCPRVIGHASPPLGMYLSDRAECLRDNNAGTAGIILARGFPRREMDDLTAVVVGLHTRTRRRRSRLLRSSVRSTGARPAWGHFVFGPSRPEQPLERRRILCSWVYPAGNFDQDSRC
jgi:hypothetical protein